MKNSTRLSCFSKTLVAFLFLFAANSYGGTIDTLRHYNFGGGTAGANLGYKMYMERFIPKAPGYVDAIVVTLAGASSTGSVTVHLFGQEAGTDAPAMRKDLITPIVAGKTAKGLQKLTVTLPSPIYMDNTQFWVGLTNVSNGVVPLRDVAEKAPFCSSTTGGDYYYQYYLNSGDTMFVDVYAYIIDAVMDYDYSASP